MKHSFVMCANWKMNKNPKEAVDYLCKIKQWVPVKKQKHFVFFAPALVLSSVAEELSRSFFRWGAQNCHYEDKGAFTGENSPLVLQQMGATDCLVGHSERRIFFKESNTLIKKKLQALIKHSITPTLCVGENFQQRQNKEHFKTVLKQLQPVLSLKPPALVQIAYEPMWAIGSSRPAKKDQIRKMHQFIYTVCKEAGVKTALLYGGSVGSANAFSLAQIPKVQGFLAGRLSLNPKEFFDVFKLTARQV